MNKAFRTYWSKVRQQCVVVSEAQKAPRKKRGGVVTQVALAVLAATLGTAQAADTSSWTVTGKDEVLTEDMDVSGFAYGRIEGFTGWDTQPDTNKLTIAEGVTMTGGVFRYENDDFWGEERNEGESGKTGLMRYHTFVVNGTLKDGETYHDVATNSDKDQIGTVNWFNRVAVGSTGTVNVKEIRVSETLVNEGNLTVGDLYVKTGSLLNNSGTITINNDAYLGVSHDIFNNNTLESNNGVKYENFNDGATFVNSGTVIGKGSLFTSVNISDTENAGQWSVDYWGTKNGTIRVNDVKANQLVNGNNVSFQVNNNLTITKALENDGKVTAGVFNIAEVRNSSGTITATDEAGASVFGKTSNANIINLAGTAQFGAVTNSGTISIAKDAVMASLNQTAGTTTALKDLTLTDNSTISGNLYVSNSLNADDFQNLGNVKADSAVFGKFHNGVGLINNKAVFSLKNGLKASSIENIGSITAGWVDTDHLWQHDDSASIEFTDENATTYLRSSKTFGNQVQGSIKAAGDVEAGHLMLYGQATFLKNLTTQRLALCDNKDATLNVTGGLTATALYNNQGQVFAHEVFFT